MPPRWHPPLLRHQSVARRRSLRPRSSQRAGGIACICICNASHRIWVAGPPAHGDACRLGGGDLPPARHGGSACLRQQSATGPCAFLPRRACLHSSSCLAAGMVWLSKKLRRPRAIVQARAAGVRVKCWLVSLFFVCGFSVVVCAFEDLDDVFRAD
jgi:hypothetical protein